jgi:hypothetical protein
VSREAFPNIPIGEFTITRPFTAPGLFAYRHQQAEGLLHFPDLGGGDMNEEQRNEALKRMVNVYRPLAALVLFLGVVALEDFIRDLGARLADLQGLTHYFPEILKLRPVLKKNPRPYAQQDKDPAPLSNWPEVNTLYKQAIGIEPFVKAGLPKLHDLALIRHTVAHHAALVRQIDVPRFQYWDITANVLINPPVEFVQETTLWLYQIGRRFENEVADRVFSKIISDQPPNWYLAPSNLILELIETFNWFGKLMSNTDILPIPGHTNYEAELNRKSVAIRSQLTQLCIDELRDKHTTVS